MEFHTHPEKPFPDDPNAVYKPYYFSAPPVRFNGSHGDLFIQSRKLDMLFNYTMTRIKIKDGAASSVFIRESSSNRTPLVEIFERKIVCADGGIQNVRLLQISGLNEPSVGRYFSMRPRPTPTLY